MKHCISTKILLPLLFAILAAALFKPAAAQGGQSTLARRPFALQVVSGPLFASTLDKEKPDFRYVQTDLRFCWPLDPEKTAEKIALGGYFDLIFELTGSAIFEGPGSYLAGATFLFRYNFLRRHRSLAPYFQLGAGIVLNDAYQDESQTLIGQAVEFTPQAAIGLHYFIDKSRSLDAEIMYHHISNANLAERNMGTNAIGGVVGFTLFF